LPFSKFHFLLHFISFSLVAFGAQSLTIVD